jgi:hypothetical protein
MGTISDASLCTFDVLHSAAIFDDVFCALIMNFIAPTDFSCINECSAN